MDELELEQRLRDSGGEVRTGAAPDRHDTAAALTAVVTRRAAHRWIAPAALVGVAATVIGLLLWLSRPSDEAEPAPAQSTPDATHVESDFDGTTPTEPDRAELVAVDWRVDNENWDGRGGRCLTVATDGTDATGCLEGNRAGLSVWATIGTRTILLVPTDDGYLAWQDPFGDVNGCDPGRLARGRLYEFHCSGGLRQGRMVPTSPIRDFTPVVPRGLPYTFDPVRVDGVSTAAAYLSQPLDGGGDRCLVLVVDSEPGWREACGEFVDGDRLALLVDGSVWLLEVDADRVLISSVATSAATYGCADTLVEILGRLDRISIADGLACSGSDGFVTATRHGVTLARNRGTHPSRVCFGTTDCRAPVFRESPLPIAPGAAHIPPTDIIRVDDLTSEAGDVAVPPGGDAAAIGTAVGDHFQDPAAQPGELVRSVDVIDEGLIVLVTVAVFDDAAGDETYAVWLTERDNELAIDRLFRINTCARGIVVEDGQRLCV